MASKIGKLELTWVNKEQRPRLEPRLLLEDPGKSYGDPKSPNMLIRGDNLLALKALEQDFAGKVKCVFIDPPYNTGSAFEHYDDGIEHSIWLSLLRDRLEILHRLLKPDGSIWITIDDNEGHYLKVLCDEVFGRTNFLGTVTWEKTTSVHNNATYFPVEVNLALRTAKDEFQGITSQELANDPKKLELVVEQIAQKQVALIEAQRREQAATVATQPAQGEMFKPGGRPAEQFDADKFKEDLKEKLRVEIQRFAGKNIDIPRITTIVNTKEIRLDFTAKPALIGLELVEQKLRASNLATGQERTDETVEVLEIAEPRNFLAGRLLQGLDELSFADKDFVLKAVDDYIAGLGKPEAELKKLVHLYRVSILEDLKKQIRANIKDEAEVEHIVADGFIVFGGFTKTVFADGGTLPLREQISQASEIRRYIFTGLTKCLFDCAAFDSTPEKTLAEIMEDDKAVLK